MSLVRAGSCHTSERLLSAALPLSSSLPPTMSTHMHMLPGSAATQWPTASACQHSDEQWQPEQLQPCDVDSPLRHDAQHRQAQHRQPAWTEEDHEWTQQRTAQRSNMDRHQDERIQQAPAQPVWAAAGNKGPQKKDMLSLSTAHVQKDPRLRPPAGFHSTREMPSPTRMARWLHVQNPHDNPAPHGSPVSSPCNLPVEVRMEPTSPGGNDELDVPPENWLATFTPANQSPLAAVRKRSGATGTFGQRQRPPADQSLFHTHQNRSQSMSQLLQRTAGGIHCSDDEDDLAGLLQSQGVTPGTGLTHPRSTHRMPQAWGLDKQVRVPTPACASNTAQCACTGSSLVCICLDESALFSGRDEGIR